MRFREILLLLLVLAAGTCVYYAQTGRVPWGWDGGGGWHVLHFGRQEEFSFDEAEEIAAPLPPLVRVLNRHGSVAVAGSGDGRVRIELRKRVWERTQARAARTAADLRLVLDRSENALIVSTNRDAFRRARFETDIKVFLPEGTAVLVRNSYGPVRLEKTGPAEIVNPHGSVTVSGVAGDLTLESSFEDAEIGDVRGDARITASHATVKISRVGGRLIVSDAYGAIRAEEIGGPVTVDAPHAAVFLRDLKAEAEVSGSYEKIVLRETAGVRVLGRHGDLDAAGVRGPLDVATNDANIEVSGLTGSLTVRGRNVGLTARDLGTGEIRLETSYRDASLAGFSGPAFLHIEHGDVTLEPAAPLGSLEVQGAYAAVRLVWPAGERNPFEAAARAGTIVWELAEKPSLQTENGTSELKAFPDAAGRPAVKLRTTYGDITVSPGPGRRRL